MSFRETVNGIFQLAQSGFRGNDSGNAPVLLMLGGFKFSLNTAVFQQLQRSTAYRWPAQERVGQLDALQFTGPGEDRITLPGIVYPDLRGDASQISQLRDLAKGGRPLRLISSSGEILGLWVIESVEETQSLFKPDGAFRRQEFNLTIRKFSDDADV